MEKEKIMGIMQGKKVVQALITAIDRNPGRLTTIATGAERGNTITDAYEGEDGMAYIITYVSDGSNRKHMGIFATAIEVALRAYKGLSKHNVRFITVNGEGVEITGMPSIAHPSPYRTVMCFTDDNAVQRAYTAETSAIRELLAVLRGEGIEATTELGKMATTEAAKRKEKEE